VLPNFFGPVGIFFRTVAHVDRLRFSATPQILATSTIVEFLAKRRAMIVAPQVSISVSEHLCSFALSWPATDHTQVLASVKQSLHDTTKHF
jgi:hypothetical protein